MEGTATAKGKFGEVADHLCQKLNAVLLISSIETVRRVRDYVHSNPALRHDKTKFVEGWGWDHTKWVQSTFPTAVRILPHRVPIDRARADSKLPLITFRLT